ncbi:MAG: hypothetical protein L3J20_00960 [Flavobacteriaceae bacterium]|nr:hypothetical protein [Flavobacteriaceae bacterium]
MKYFFLAISISLFLSCSTQQKVKSQIVLLTDSIQKPYAFLSELKIVSKNKILSEKINRAIQQLSENEAIKTIIPEERLTIKKKLLEDCFNLNNSECSYILEGYKVLSNINNILNIKYSYNGFENNEIWNKYACFDLETGERITYDLMFINPNIVLEEYNQRYISEIKTYIKKNKLLTEESKEEYELYKEHLEMKTPFKLQDLNNFVAIYDKTDKIKSVRFQYNGTGGVYKSMFPNGYIEFTIDELKPIVKKYLID